MVVAVIGGGSGSSEGGTEPGLHGFRWRRPAVACPGDDGGDRYCCFGLSLRRMVVAALCYGLP
jgi:hypothetical protein